jgi:hypothetical protein
MPKKYPTTLIFDVGMHRRIREYQVKHDDSMKDIVYKALDQYLKTAEKNLKRLTPTLAAEEDNKFTCAVLFELEKELAPDTAVKVLEEKCKLHKILADCLSPSTLTPEIISDICRSIERLTDRESAQKVEQRLLFITGGGS